MYANLDGKACEDEDLMEMVACLACDGSESLLMCKEDGCGFAIHDKCLPCLAYFDASGSFYCPRCSYERAEEECLRAKKRASLAKQALLKFISGNNHQPEAKGADRKRPSPSTSARDVDHLAEAGNLRKKGDSDLCKRTDFPDSSHKEHCANENHDVEDFVRRVPEADVCEANEGGEAQPQILQKTECPARPGSMGICQDTGHVDNMFNVTTATQRKRRADSDKIRGKGKGRDDLYIEVSDLSDSDIGTRNKKPNVKRHQREGRAKRVQSSGKSDIQNVKADESVKGSQAQELAPLSLKNKSDIADNQGKIGASPYTRRRIQWTADEVEILKEGMQKFSSPNKNIPWGRILEYGSQVFHRSRAASDLKDKWRSLTK